MIDNNSKFRLTKSVTGALLISSLLVAFLAPRWGLLDDIDDQMFRFGTVLLPEPDAIDNTYIVHIPDDLIQNPDSIKQLRQSLSRLHKNKSASIALLTPQLPSLDYQLKEESGSDTGKIEPDTNKDEWQLAQGELTKLAWTLENYKVIVGLPVPKPAFTKPDNESFIDFMNSLLFSKLNPSFIESFQNSYKYKIAPYLSPPDSRHKTSLLWKTENNKITPDLSLEIYKKSKRINKHDWSKSEGIKVGKELIRTDNTGTVMSYFPVTAVPDIKNIKLDELFSLSRDKIKGSTFILGTDEAALMSTASHFSSLSSGASYHTSTWANWFKKLAFVFVFIYLLLFVGKLQKHTGYLLSLLLLFGALAFQYGLLLTQSVWLPLISLYLFLILGHFVVWVKKSIDSKMDALILHTHEALWHLAQYQYEQGDQEKSLTNLRKCSPTADVLDLMYNIGQGFERRRQYDKALNLYSDIDARDGGYKDVKKRLQSLFSISGNQTDVTSPLQAGKTLLMPDLGLQLPVFGRYEIERELGRGAMGVVYLGKDPKINRQVAIKTLDYSQFSESEIKTFKSRFFREAEAAGRLNHSSIVTVYDVGEEEDFAFIAMDYIQGKSLDAFSKPDTLLPIQEVYEIVATVAETLNYAHSQKIVHRDIKPSNIMYEPKTHQVKVTDFGIARITDNAHTRTGSFLGSPSYMSPEQMLGSKVGSHADIYALGVSFYQLLTGELPFKADSIGNLAHLIANKKHKPVRDIRSELPSSATRIINKALQKKPGDRYKTGKEMADAIRRAMPDND
ncbi:MAG: serine/threonine protein kinase [Gammaproteobacteria bacterium]|nr:serine/threonine protein kinase [Gammaproteobacteria bacterium]